MPFALRLAKQIRLLLELASNLTKAPRDFDTEIRCDVAAPDFAEYFTAEKQIR